MQANKTREQLKNSDPGTARSSIRETFVTLREQRNNDVPEIINEVTGFLTCLNEEVELEHSVISLGSKLVER